MGPPSCILIAILLIMVDYTIAATRPLRRASKQNKRPVRSFGLDYWNCPLDVDLWTDSYVSFAFPPFDPFYEFQYDLDRIGNVAPQFSNVIESPLPTFMAGPEAKRIANYMYSKELFFEQVPHERALLQNQQLRIANGLQPNILHSIRYHSPFLKA